MIGSWTFTSPNTSFAKSNGSHYLTKQKVSGVSWNSLKVQTNHPCLPITGKKGERNKRKLLHKLIYYELHKSESITDGRQTYIKVVNGDEVELDVE